MFRSDLTAESFNQVRQAVAGTPMESARVRLGLWSRQVGRLIGMTDVVALARRRGGAGLSIRSRADGEDFNPDEVVLAIEGPFPQVVPLATESTGLLSLSAGAGAMAELIATAGGLPVIDMSAGAFPPEWTPRISVAAAAGGASATATRAGHAEAHARFGIGGGRIRVGGRDPAPFDLHTCVPAGLHAAAGAVVESAASWHNRFSPKPMTVELGAPGAERDAVSALVQRFHSNLHAVQIVLPPDRLIQGGHDRPHRAIEMRILSQAADRRTAQAALERFGFGPGLSVEAVYLLRDLLDSLGARMTKIVLAGDIDTERIRALRACKAPMDSIASTSWVCFAPFEAAIVDVWRDDAWQNALGDNRHLLSMPETWPISLEI